MSTLKQTPLHAWHINANAKMAPFAGWNMPIQYVGIIAEHKHTRENASLFDICHMGEFMLKGAGAKDALSKVVTHNLATLAVGKCRYGFLLNENGCVIDDLIIYHLAEDDFMLVVNGARADVDFACIKERIPSSISLEDVSEATAKIDLQGPEALEALEAISGQDFHSLKYFSFVKTTIGDIELMVSRTGYTGELGYEFYLPADKALAFWEACLADERVAPAGLGARDTLRLEIGYPLYGQDLDENHTPAEAGFEMMLSSEAEYVGKGKDREVNEKLIALNIPDRRSARPHDEVMLPSGEVVGQVTSGSFCPSLKHAAALAYVKIEHAEQATYQIKTARSTLEATRVALPFYTKGTARKKLA